MKSLMGSGKFFLTKHNKSVGCETIMNESIEINSPFPLIISTVDIIVFDSIENPTKILLGRKIKDPNLKWRFPGGFADKNNYDDESDAIRELKEETGLTVESVTYIGSCPIDDPRYRNTPHQIRTRVFITEANSLYKNLQASDDLESVSWFDLRDINLFNSLIKEHMPVFDLLIFKMYDFMPNLCSKFDSQIAVGRHSLKKEGFLK
jgi:ADP-ribose pyrophosphatase YjhB (NUDIX family)